MFNEPLFQNHILSTMYKYFSYWFSYDNWMSAFLPALFTLYIIYKIITYKNKTTYPDFFPSEKYTFSMTNDKFSLYFALFCLLLYSINIYMQELSFFNNYDTMSSNTMLALEKGTTPVLGFHGRFSPFSFWEGNIIYAITHNFLIINFFILIQVLIILYLAYRLFDFIPVTNRLVALGLILISPSFFWINNIIFPERMLLIYFLSSFLCLKRYTQTKQTSMLWFFTFFLNMALYTKETSALLFVGFLIYSFLINLWNEKITFRSFIHPLQTIKTFPIEISIFISLLIYSLFYAVYSSEITDSLYISLRVGNITEILKLYKCELLITLLSLILWLKNRKSDFFFNSLLIGSYITTIVIAFILKLKPIAAHVELKPYYMFLPNIICLIYIIKSLKFKQIIWTSILFTALFMTVNYKIYQNEEGKYYRQIGAFVSNLNKDKLSIFIALNSEHSQWRVSCWASVYKYYLPDKLINFSSPLFQGNDMNTLTTLHWSEKYSSIFHRIKAQKKPQTGDLYIIKKTPLYKQDLSFIDNIPHHLIYQNNLFEVYEIK